MLTEPGADEPSPAAAFPALLHETAEPQHSAHAMKNAANLFTQVPPKILFFYYITAFRQFQGLLQKVAEM
jgi:hypothetical protein